MVITQASLKELLSLTTSSCLGATTGVSSFVPAIPTPVSAPVSKRERVSGEMGAT